MTMTSKRKRDHAAINYYSRLRAKRSGGSRRIDTVRCSGGIHVSQVLSIAGRHPGLQAVARRREIDLAPGPQKDEIGQAA